MEMHLVQSFSQKSHLLFCFIQQNYKARGTESHLLLNKEKFFCDLTKIKVKIYIMHAKSQICLFLVSEKFPQ